jgi:hypothetical protein
MRLARATVPAPASSGDWIVHTVDAAIASDSMTMLIEDGRLALAYEYYFPKSLKFARATTATPTQPADWQLTTVAAVNALSPRARLIDGRLAIAYQQGSETRLTRALTLTPSSPSDWSTTIADASGSAPSIADSTGRTLLAYVAPSGGLRVVSSVAGPCW